MNQQAKGSETSAGDRSKFIAISLPINVWQEIELELRARGAWWLANQLVNTGSTAFAELNRPPSHGETL